MFAKRQEAAVLAARVTAHTAVTAALYILVVGPGEAGPEAEGGRLAAEALVS